MCEGTEGLWMDVGHVTTLMKFRVPFRATHFLKRDDLLHSEQRVRSSQQQTVLLGLVRHGHVETVSNIRTQFWRSWDGWEVIVIIINHNEIGCNRVQS